MESESLKSYQLLIYSSLITVPWTLMFNLALNRLSPLSPNWNQSQCWGRRNLRGQAGLHKQNLVSKEKFVIFFLLAKSEIVLCTKRISAHITTVMCALINTSGQYVLHNRASQDYKDLWEAIPLRTWILKNNSKRAKVWNTFQLKIAALCRSCPHFYKRDIQITNKHKRCSNH